MTPRQLDAIVKAVFAEVIDSRLQELLDRIAVQDVRVDLQLTRLDELFESIGALFDEVRELVNGRRAARPVRPMLTVVSNAEAVTP